MCWGFLLRPAGTPVETALVTSTFTFTFSRRDADCFLPADEGNLMFFNVSFIAFLLYLLIIKLIKELQF